MAAASLAVMGEPEPPDPALDDLRYELFSDLQEIMEAEPRFIEDQARAQECIESAGHRYRDEDQLWIYLEEQDAVLQDTIDTSLDNRPTVFVGQLTSNQPGEDPLEIRSTVTPIPDEDEAELVMADDELAEYTNSVHAEEVTLARAYLDCDATLLPIMTSAVYRDVRIEIEEQFIRDNRTAFERLGFFDE